MIASLLLQVALTANPYLGLPPTPYDPMVSPRSPDGALNPHTTGGGIIVADDGTFLGRLNANVYDPCSVANPYSPFGSPYSRRSINNKYGKYGSPYSSSSATNPYAVRKVPRVRY